MLIAHGLVSAGTRPNLRAMSSDSDTIKAAALAALVTFGPVLVYASDGDHDTAGHINDLAAGMANTIQSSSTSAVAAGTIMVPDTVNGGEIRYLPDRREVAGGQMTDVSSAYWWTREKP